MIKSSLTPSNNPLIVFLADDDPDDRSMFQEVIQEVGPAIQLTCAEDGKVLLHLLHHEQATMPNLLFLDLNMPNKNGKECLEEIRKSDRFKHIPIVIYSTSSSPKDIDDTFERGANLYVRKPSSFQELRLIVKSIVALDWNNYKPHALKNNFVFLLNAL